MDGCKNLQKWLDDFNAKMVSESRKILLILDNAPIHLFDLEFSNIEFLFLPANSTSLLQPCDQGIIKTFKTNYKKFINQKVMSDNDISINEIYDIQQIIKN